LKKDVRFERKLQWKIKIYPSHTIQPYVDSNCSILIYLRDFSQKGLFKTC
jgi:hypothetical protein